MALLRGLANPHRHRVFLAACRGPVRGRDVVQACGVSAQEASRHLARLTDMGLLERRGRDHAPTAKGRRLEGLLAEMRGLASDRVVQEMARATSLPPSDVAR